MMDEKKEREAAFEAWMNDQSLPEGDSDLYVAGWLARSQSSAPAWIACSERMPEEGQDCLVLLCWDDQQPYVGIDTWHMGSERPLEFSSATIETGLEWAEHDYDEISHWMPLPAPPCHQPQEPARGNEQ